MTVSVYNVSGCLMMQSKVQGDEATIDMSAMPKGLYILDVNRQVSRKIAIR